MSDIAIEGVAEVGKLAVTQELKLRLLANKTKSIENAAYENKVSDTEEAIVNHFQLAGKISSIEIAQLKISRQIRNKILHCEFDKALKLISELTGKKVDSPVVSVIKTTGLSTAEFLSRMKEGLSKPITEFKYKEVGLFGWLMQMHGSGGFHEAIGIFKRTNAIIDRLIDDELIGIRPGKKNNKGS